MRKVVVLLILGALTVNVNAGTIMEILDIVDVEVKLQARNNLKNNYDFKKIKDERGTLLHNDYTQFYDLKTEASLKADITDELSANVELELSEDKVIAGKDKTITPQWLHDNLEIKRAYFEVKNIADVVNLRIGRQDYGEEYKSFVGYFSKLDHCAVELDWEPISLIILTGKIKDPDTGDQNEDESFHGLLAQTAIHVGTLKFAVYDRTQEWKEGRTLSNVVWNVDARGEITSVAGLSYEAELAYQTSQRLGVRGVKHDALGGRLKGIYTAQTAVGKWRFAGEYLYTSGDRKNTAKYEEYTGVKICYTPYDFGRLEDLVPISFENPNVAGLDVEVGGVELGKDLGNKNVFAVNVGFAPTAIENLFTNFYLAKWNYTQEVQKEKDIGLEFAVGADFAPTENITLGALFGYFIPGKAIKKLIDGKDPAVKLQTAVGVKF